MEYSVNLFESELALFEVVSAEEEERVRRMRLEFESTLASFPRLGVCQPGRRFGRNDSVHANQLSLFVPDDFE